ncbi:hypothetical protein [Bacillus sp. AFS040349]|uniref:hypothetical protein n=1 Tax=Bacillus sp. AFS040349 TaxID=2033502 RepID=UPI000BFE0663|nr:hypothetical protein [Bacillus sp. AFS040349]PGT79784.1 hypothetical protein COD11_22010 [Bacillus sp. AFS040349]
MSRRSNLHILITNDDGSVSMSGAVAGAGLLENRNPEETWVPYNTYFRLCCYVRYYSEVNTTYIKIRYILYLCP